MVTIVRKNILEMRLSGSLKWLILYMIISSDCYLKNKGLGNLSK